MLIETLFLWLFELDQSKIKEIVQEIVNIHNGVIFKNGTKIYKKYYRFIKIYEGSVQCENHLCGMTNFIIIFAKTGMIINKHKTITWKIWGT